MKKRGKALQSKTTTRADFVTSEFLQHHRVEDAEIVHFGDGKDIKPHRALAKRNMTQRPIDQYFYMGSLSDVGSKGGRKDRVSIIRYMAAERFYQDWYLMGASPRLTANLTGVGGGGAPNYGTDRQQAARDRHRAALLAIDMYDQGFVLDVVCFEQYLGGQLMKNRITIRTRFDRLRDALDRLARHYGIG